MIIISNIIYGVSIYSFYLKNFLVSSQNATAFFIRRDLGLIIFFLIICLHIYPLSINIIIMTFLFRKHLKFLFIYLILWKFNKVSEIYTSNRRIQHIFRNKLSSICQRENKTSNIFLFFWYFQFVINTKYFSMSGLNKRDSIWPIICSY